MKHGLRAMALHCAECTDPPADAREEAHSVLGPKHSVMKPKSKRPAKVAKADKRMERTDRMAESRACVMERADDRCEVCEDEPATAVHHVISGSGLRRRFEDSSTCIALCDGCHRSVHRNDRSTLQLVYAWAEKHSNRFALGALERRMDKLPEPA